MRSKIVIYDPDLLDIVKEKIEEGKIIQAIAIYKRIEQCSLQEAKHAVDLMRAIASRYNPKISLPTFSSILDPD